MAAPEITDLLRAWGSGNIDAHDRLWPEVYEELKIIALSVLRGKRQAQGKGTTSLVHEAALRILNLEIDWNDRHHFYAGAARAMRYVLVDDARRRLAQKRAPDQGSDEIPEDVADPRALRPEEVLAVHEALERLRRINARQEKLVELRYFAGMSVDESAEVLGVSIPTVVRDWRAARIWLHGRLNMSGDPSDD